MSPCPSSWTHLSLQVTLVLLVEVLESLPVGPLGVGVNVHLDDAVADGAGDLLLGGARAAVHHQEGGLGLEEHAHMFNLLTGKSHFPVPLPHQLAAELLLDEGLVSGQQLGAEDNVAGLVDAVDVAKGGGDREHGADGTQGLVHVPNLETRTGVNKNFIVG